MNQENEAAAGRVTSSAALNHHAPQITINAPAWQFYPADWLADMRIRMLSWAGRGLLIELLCYCWREGWIPSDSSAIAQLSGCHDTAIIEQCLAMFSPHPSDGGKLVHLRLDAEREKQRQFREERKASGKRGAEQRWERERQRRETDGSAIKQPMAKNGSSVFSLQSSEEPPTPKGKRVREVFQKPTIEEIAAYGLTLTPPFNDAEELFHHYNSKGWKVGNAPMTDWKSAVWNWHRRNHKQSPSTNKPSNRAKDLGLD